MGATKQVRVGQSQEDRSKLKPSQVTQTSNIFGPSLSNDDEVESDSDDHGNSEQEVDGDSADSASEGEEMDEDEDDDEFDVEAASEDDEDETVQVAGTKKRKKNDPTDFALAMQKILSSGLTSSNRKNPILARSLESKKLDDAAEDERLESKVRKQMTAEKRAKLDKNHNARVIGETDDEMARSIEKERGMRKVAQRGVVRLFNAIRAAQLAAQDGEGGDERDERTGLRVRQGAGVKKREVKAQELSKSSFLDLIKSGGR
ncbi:Predicted protein [Taphrina deformans PYCC 5710]|uniref:Rrp15p-domain-containing protein n=1 Tax=Taphrina deformans (strain PYCC 5710 / ATCC 11124 / CBS 356.35 / IMI 108563 / JCM 9778 / NBRC 8474) TaxID=1097556 RepID=R4X8R6_TAPDE|nr:Predicted protein [Taphrina deformans PYCC 5710]|eukprot:CCG82039.1 Predicted protein [Taphrina deformans PYCC 5710]